MSSSQERQAPPSIYAACSFLCERLWPNINFPRINIILDGHPSYQGSMRYGRGSSTAEMRLKESLLTVDVEDTFSSIAHELCHLVIEFTGREDSQDGHGPNWRAEMRRIGLPVASNTTRETVEKGGLFWTHLQEWLARAAMPEISVPATIPAQSAPATIGDSGGGSWFGFGARRRRGGGQPAATVQSAPSPSASVQAAPAQHQGTAVAAPQATTIAPRQTRDRTGDIKNSLAHSATRAQLGGEIVNIAGFVDNIAHDLHNLAQDHNTTRAELDWLAQADAATLEAVQLLRQQRELNVQHRQADSERHTAMLHVAGERFAEVASAHIGNELLLVAEQTANSRGIPGRPAFEQRALTSATVNRAMALLSAPIEEELVALLPPQRENGQVLPPPTQTHALPPPSQALNGMPLQQRELVPVSQAPASRTRYGSSWSKKT